MWWLKCIGSLLIVGGCGFIGWEKSAALRRRIWILREMNQRKTGRDGVVAADGG